jgi:hydroxymethylpyrimidine/phosphomethylpyrimidine kinase
MAMTRGPHVLIVAGSDSSGGAGVARDIAALTRFGVRASLAVTAVTAQTHAAVSRIDVMPASLVVAQMRSALAAEPVAAVKVGMLANEEIVKAVADLLARHDTMPVVLDPVVASTSGVRLLSEAGIECLLARLLPITALVTPNLPELGILTGSCTARSETELARQVLRLRSGGKSSVLVKGGHAHGDKAIDTLHAAGKPPVRFVSRRRRSAMRGTGCMLSSAIAAHLALGGDMLSAISAAKAYVDDMFDAQEVC